MHTARWCPWASGIQEFSPPSVAKNNGLLTISVQIGRVSFSFVFFLVGRFHVSEGLYCVFNRRMPFEEHGRQEKAFCIFASERFPKYDMAVSFCTKNSFYATQQLVECLRAKGHSVFFDRVDGENWWGMYFSEAAAKTYGNPSTFVIALMCNDYFGTPYTRAEYGAARSRAPNFEKAGIFCVCVGNSAEIMQKANQFQPGNGTQTAGSKKEAATPSEQPVHSASGPAVAEIAQGGSPQQTVETAKPASDVDLNADSTFCAANAASASVDSLVDKIEEAYKKWTLSDRIPPAWTRPHTYMMPCSVPATPQVNKPEFGAIIGLTHHLASLDLLCMIRDVEEETAGADSSSSLLVRYPTMAMMSTAVLQRLIPLFGKLKLCIMEAPSSIGSSVDDPFS